MLARADAVATVPEIGRARLIRDIAQKAHLLAVLNFPEDLTAELEVVTLLVNRERTVAFDVHAVFDIRDEIVRADILLACGGLKTDVRHTLERHVAPVVAV